VYPNAGLCFSWYRLCGRRGSRRAFARLERDPPEGRGAAPLLALRCRSLGFRMHLYRNPITAISVRAVGRIESSLLSRRKIGLWRSESSVDEGIRSTSNSYVHARMFALKLFRRGVSLSNGLRRCKADVFWRWRQF
jgi:hypothetical protein